MSVPTFTKSGAKATTPATLDKAIFGVEVKNHQLLKDAYLAFLANGRPNLATTKKRGQVRGGGQKPWRQKGTGRARVGSSRNPVWRGGGVAFGPSGDENYTKRLNVPAKRQALKQALSLANKEDRLRVIEDLALDGKVKSASSLTAKLNAGKNCLFVVNTVDDKLHRSTRNLQGVELISARGVSAFEIMNADTVIITKPAIEALQNRLKETK